MSYQALGILRSGSPRARACKRPARARDAARFHAGAEHIRPVLTRRGATMMGLDETRPRYGRVGKRAGPRVSAAHDVVARRSAPACGPERGAREGAAISATRLRNAPRAACRCVKRTDHCTRSSWKRAGEAMGLASYGPPCQEAAPSVSSLSACGPRSPRRLRPSAVLARAEERAVPAPSRPPSEPHSTNRRILGGFPRGPRIPAPPPGSPPGARRGPRDPRGGRAYA
jgi:hypothetical protein